MHAPHLITDFLSFSTSIWISVSDIQSGCQLKVRCWLVDGWCFCSWLFSGMERETALATMDQDEVTTCVLIIYCLLLLLESGREERRVRTDETFLSKFMVLGRDGWLVTCNEATFRRQHRISPQLFFFVRLFVFYVLPHKLVGS